MALLAAGVLAGCSPPETSGTLAADRNTAASNIVTSQVPEPAITATLPPPDTEDPEAAEPGTNGPGTGDRDAVLAGLVVELEVDQAVQLVQDLPASTEATENYDRDSYGIRWADIDGNGCNQRDDVLLRDAVAGSTTMATQGTCAHDVLAGTWVDPYTGTTLSFTDLKDPAQAQALQIDHIVPLAEAHRSGAASWDLPTREVFANDLANLVAADGPTNNAKGDRDPARWLPPHPPTVCPYVLAWVSIKHTYSLGVDDTERQALLQTLGGCVTDS